MIEVLAGASYKDGITMHTKNFKATFKERYDQPQLKKIRGQFFTILYGVLKNFVLIIVLLCVLFYFWNYYRQTTAVFLTIIIVIFILFEIRYSIVKNLIHNYTSWRKYHGAEHKIVGAFYRVQGSGQKKYLANVNNIKKESITDVNCGTSYFILFIILLLISFIFHIVAAGVLLLFIIILSQIIKSKSNTYLEKVFAILLWIQRHTVVSEPTEKELKCGLKALEVLMSEEGHPQEEIEAVRNALKQIDENIKMQQFT